MDEKTNRMTRKQAALIGAIVAHPVVGAVAFVLGAIVGCKPPMPDAARAVNGLQGGDNAVQALVTAYWLTFGIAPLVISTFGASIAVILAGSRNVANDEEEK